MGQGQSNSTASDLTESQGAPKQQQQQQHQLPPGQQQQQQHPASAQVHPSIVIPHATATPAITLNTTSSMAALHPMREYLPAVIIESRGTFKPSHPQPYLPHAQATLTYLDTLLSRAEATRDVHRANVALVADRLKTIHELTMERMNHEAKQKEEQRAAQTEMTIAEHEKVEEDYGEPFTKRVRRQLIDETQSLYMDSLEQQQQHDASFSPIADGDLPPAPLPQLFSTSDSSSVAHMSSDVMSTEDLLAILNPMEIYAAEASNLENDTGLIGGVATGTTQGESELFVNKVMADLEETHRTSSPDRASTVVAASSDASLNNSAATSVIDTETPAWSQSSRSWNNISTKFLANFQKINALAVLERAHQNGNISLDVLTQWLAFIKMLLKQEDHDSLMQQFNAMHLHERSPTVATDGSTASCLQTAIALASTQIPVWVDDLIPEECAPDDPDGVPRLRFLLRYSTSADETYQQIQEEKKRRAAAGGGAGGGRKQKRKQSDRDDDDSSANSDYLKVLIKPNESSEIIPEIGSTSSSVVSSSSTTTTLISPAPTQVAYRIGWLNSAFERTFGYTQLQARHEFAVIGQKVIYMFCRSDHIAAFHLILARMKFEGRNEIHMYQVRTTNDGREIYCLVHMRVNSVQGKMMDSCQSIIPLPDEAQKDMPPFQEGVDLHEDVLLYGYKRPSC